MQQKNSVQSFRVIYFLCMYTCTKATAVCDFSSQGIADINMALLAPCLNSDEITYIINSISFIPNTYFIPLPVTTINLRSNQLSTIEDFAFQNLQNLTTLKIFYNTPLRRITKNMLKGLSKLEFLQLNLNSIDTLEKGCFSDLSSLQTLMLDNNDLKHIFSAIFDPLNRPSNLHSFKFSNNPIECDCDLTWLVRADGVWLTVSYSSMTSCAGPAAMAGRVWNTLNEHEFSSHGKD